VANQRVNAPKKALKKVLTGISGFDQITGGGLPAGRTSLVCGAAGCGKTLFGTEFLVRGALDYKEPGALIAFEETADDLTKNVASLGFDLADLQRKKLLSIDHIRIEPNEIVESGDYDLEGLFIRIGAAIDAVGAKRVLIDTLETLFGGLTNQGIIRAELRRLFVWLKERGVTSIVTAERGDGTLTRHGLEEYVSDCVILLDHRVRDQVSTRRLRVVKYRGSTHGSNEYPFLIDEQGISVIPITASDLTHAVSDARVDTGIPTLNEMFGGAGYYSGSTILVSGTAGTGKTSVAAHFVEAACKAGNRALFVSYEESPAQILRNVRTIGIDLGKYVKRGLLRMVSHRTTSFGLEAHLAVLHKLVSDVDPQAVVIDPITTMDAVGGGMDAQLMLVRLIDFLKARGTTALLTSLSHGASAETSEVGISSIVDTWLLVKAIETNGERTRGLYVLKSRGMSHSNQIREFLITDHGVKLVPPYVGAEGVLTGTARAIQEAREGMAIRKRTADSQRAARVLERKRALLEQRIAELRAEFDSEEVDLLEQAKDAARFEGELSDVHHQMARARGGQSDRQNGQRGRKGRPTSARE
jgi:circadian clock protein KaiC